MDEPKEPSPKNPHLEAFIAWCGGPTQASFKLRVSSATIHDWRRAGFFRDREKAIEAASLCDWQWTPTQLLGLPEMPDVDPPKNGRKDQDVRNDRQSDADGGTTTGSDLDVVPQADQLQKQVSPRGAALPLPIDKDDPQGTGCSPHSQAA